MRHAIRRFPALWRASRLARRWYYARRDAYPVWSRPLAADRALWESARRAANGGPRVLMATGIGSYAHAVTLESALAAAYKRQPNAPVVTIDHHVMRLAL